MDAGNTMGPIGFDMLITKHVPHILEKIFFTLDYEAYKNCLYVCLAWNKLLTTETYQRRGHIVFHEDILRDKQKLRKLRSCFAVG